MRGRQNHLRRRGQLVQPPASGHWYFKMEVSTPGRKKYTAKQTLSVPAAMLVTGQPVQVTWRRVPRPPH